VTDPILDLAKPAGTQKAMMTERRVLIEHAEAPPENDTVARRHIDNLVEMESNFHATQTLLRARNSLCAWRIESRQTRA
jgi:hypothetical protein